LISFLELFQLWPGFPKQNLKDNYFASWRGAKYCNIRVCVSICMLAYLKKHMSKFHKFLYVTSGHGSVLPKCNTLFTSVFVDDVMFAHNGPNDMGLQHAT